MSDATILSLVGIVVSAILGLFSAVLGLFSTVFAGIVAYFIAKLRTQSKNNANSIAEVHTAVNSTATRLKDKADINELEIIRLKETVSRLEEKIRGKDESLAVSNATISDQSFSQTQLKQLGTILSK